MYFDINETIGRFPSPHGVMFSLILKNEKVLSAKKFKKFLSPLGVIFSLIRYTGEFDKTSQTAEFPSPLGVIFSLILTLNLMYVI